MRFLQSLGSKRYLVIRLHLPGRADWSHTALRNLPAFSYGLSGALRAPKARLTCERERPAGQEQNLGHRVQEVDRWNDTASDIDDVDPGKAHGAENRQDDRFHGRRASPGSD